MWWGGRLAKKSHPIFGSTYLLTTTHTRTAQHHLRTGTTYGAHADVLSERRSARIPKALLGNVEAKSMLDCGFIEVVLPTIQVGLEQIFRKLGYGPGGFC